MKKALVTFSFIVLAATTYGQNSTDGLTAEFFKKYELDTDAAFDYIFSTNKWMEDSNAGTDKVKLQIKEYSKLLGKYVGFERLAEQYLGESLKVSVFLVKYERQPLRFIFKYYKPKDKWMLYNLKFDESIDDELDEIMKYNYLNNN